MRTVVERNHPHVVHHLVEDDDVVGGLEELHVVVVRARHHRRTGVEPHEAPFREPAVLRTIGAKTGRPHSPGMFPRQVRVERPDLPTHAIGQRGELPIGWLHDQRRAPVVTNFGAKVQPEPVVGADAALGRWPIDRLRERRGARLHGGSLLLGPGLANPFSALEWRRGTEVPYPLQIRPAISQTRWLPLVWLPLRYRRHRPDHDDRDDQQKRN